MKKTYHILLPLSILAIFLIFSCQKDTPSMSQWEVSEDFDTEYSDYDHENQIDITEYEGEELQERASTFKITQVVAADSMAGPGKDANNKTLKYAKRNIVYNTKKTRFWLRGIGFGDRLADTSKVAVFHKKDSLGLCDIITWTPTEVVVDVPILPNNYKNIYFSLKFKLYKKKSNITPRTTQRIESRVRSKSCIDEDLANSTRALTAAFDTCANYENAAFGYMMRKWNVSNTGLTRTAHSNFYSNKLYIGDVLYNKSGSALGTTNACVVVVSSDTVQNIYKAIMIVKRTGTDINTCSATNTPCEYGQWRERCPFEGEWITEFTLFPIATPLYESTSNTYFHWRTGPTSGTMFNRIQHIRKK
jgi:hypothetical protein